MLSHGSSVKSCGVVNKVVMSCKRGHQSVFTISCRGCLSVFNIGLQGRQNVVTIDHQGHTKVVKGSHMSQKIAQVVTRRQFGSPKTTTWQSCLSCQR